MKVLIISHAYASLNNHRKLELLSGHKDLEVGLVVPKVWPSWHGQTLSEVAARINLAYKIYPLNTHLSGNGGKYFYHPGELFQAIREFKPDIIHLEEEPWTPASFEVCLFNRLFFHQKLIFFTWENLVDLPLNFWRRLIERYTFKSATLAICGNQEAGQRIRSRGFAGAIEYLPQFGVDLGLFKKTDASQLRRQLRLEGKFVVGFVGRYVEEKGIGTLLKAMAGLGDDVSLLLVSSSPALPDNFAKMAKELGVYEKLVPASNIPYEEISKYMNLMDVFVLPSLTTKTWKEQFGRTLVEAMACQVPVLGSSSGAIPEVIGGAGLVFKEGEAEDLKQKIVQIHSSKDFATGLSQAGYRRAQEVYAYERIASRTYEIYNQVNRV
ncbi:MAG: glycosyltransferase [bacterium]|nr:glycosyltransferase [bacterium]